MICNGFWACNKRVCVQLHSHHFTIQSDSKKKRKSQETSTSSCFKAFPDISLHFVLVLRVPDLTKHTESGDNSLHLPSKTVWQESIMILSHSYNLTILDESLGKLSTYSLQYFIKEGCKNAFASAGLFSSGSTQSILTVGSLNNRSYRLPCTDALHAT